ncbi:amino acid adenylation domain-containing protein, partial [Rheinheimera soli]
DMLSKQEREHLLQLGEMNTSKPLPDECIHQLLSVEFNAVQHLFEHRVLCHPDRIALEFGTQKLSYQKLNEKANQLAHYLLSRHEIRADQADAVVGICFERSIEMVITIIAVLKSGCAYLPLDPRYPADRIDYMLDNAQVGVVLTHSACLSRFNSRNYQVINVAEPLGKDCNTDKPLVTSNRIGPDRLAYVIYTSGSTGNPKGVAVEHGAWLAFTSAIVKDYQLASEDKVLQFSSIAFDIFIEELSASVLAGGTLVIPKFEPAPLACDFWQTVKDSEVTFASLPTAYWHQLAGDEHLQRYVQSCRLQRLVVGGEPISHSHLQRWQRQVSNSVRMFNTYGPTEATVTASYFEVTEFEYSGQSVPIGKHTADSRLYVVDTNLKLVPFGAIGELVIGGPCLARGYVNNPLATEKQFVINPFYDASDALSSQRLYRTGDLVAWSKGDNLRFFGRRDHQIKLRGYRIELAEIEKQLKACQDVEDTIVQPQDGPGGDRRLVAYVVSQKYAAELNNQALVQQFIGTLKDRLKAKLPDYMVPVAYVVMAALPFTVNGKVDRKALKAPRLEDMSHEHVAPRNEIELLLCDIWAEVLGVERVGIDDNFFTLGGHSLLATRLVSRLRAGLEREVPVRALFEYPTVAALSEHLLGYEGETALPRVTAYNDQGPYPLSFAQQRLWFIDQMNGSVEYNMPGAFRLNGVLNKL